MFEAARRLAERFDGEPTASEPDLLSGTAGASLAMLALWRLLEDERFRTAAIRYGNLLLSRVKRRGSSAYWTVQTPSGKRALTGFAHGAAGIAFALLDLYSATGDERYWGAAEAAFAFERRNFHPGLQNWLDLRYPVEGDRFGPGALAASVWCHGSAGIAISRLSAPMMRNDRLALAEAELALDATSRRLKPGQASSNNPWSLCHGLSGNADILLWAAERRPDRAASLRSAARSVGDAGIALGSAGPFQSNDLGLLLGLAGIGSFYLRLANPRIPSLLVPASTEFASLPGS